MRDLPKYNSMSQENQENVFSLIYLFGIIRKYFTYIALIVGISCLLAFILTMPFIYKPEFKASATIYPTAAERYDVINLFHDEPILFLYGDAKEVEKLENIAGSEEVMMTVLDSLNLWEIYGIDKENDPSPKYSAARNYNGNVSTVRVSGNGLMIEAYDIDPQRSADMVNLIIKKVDQINGRMLNQNKTSILQMYQEGYTKLVEQLNLYTDSLRNVRKRYNVLNTETQTEMMVEQIMTAEADLATERALLRQLEESRGQAGLIAVQKNKVRSLQSKVYALVNSKGGSSINLENFREGLDEVLALKELCQYLARDVKDAQEKVSMLQTMDHSRYTTILIPEYANPSDRKSRPIRWVIMVATFLITSLVSVMGAVLVEKLTGEEAEATS